MPGSVGSTVGIALVIGVGLFAGRSLAERGESADVTPIVPGMFADDRTTGPSAHDPRLETREPDAAAEARGTVVTFPGEGFRIASSAVVHVLREHGRHARLTRAGAADDVLALDVLTNAAVGRYWMGAPAFEATADGVSFPTHSDIFTGEDSDQVHQDQCLATFADLGLPLDYRLTLPDGTTQPLSAALRAATWRSHLKQRDLEWTAMAFAAYLPPVRRWTNRFGQTLDFDALTTALLDRPWTAASCGCVHRLAALRAVADADARAPILGDGVRERLRRVLDRLTALAERTQQADGSWTLDWCADLAPHEDWQPLRLRDSDTMRTLVTGHLAEFFLRAPAGQRPAADHLDRAASWLSAQLAQADAVDRWRRLCPLTHARIVVAARTASRPDEGG